MNAQSTIDVPTLAKLREPFAPNHISKLPKETRNQIDARKTNKNLMVWNCPECGNHHHKDATHLDYVGHAALTDRLLDTDPEWSWEPVAFGQDGLPALDRNGGLWIRLTVLGVTRLGYGDADGKQGGNAVKEAIGDALRNAAMRFGAALDLWHKGDLHGDEAGDDDAPASEQKPQQPRRDEPAGMPDAEWAKLVKMAEASGTTSQELVERFKVRNLRLLNQQQYGEAIDFLNERLASKAKAETNRAADIGEDEIPY